MDSYKYLPDDTQFKKELLPWQRRGLQQTSSGYGRKLTTSQKALYNGKWYRVYCTIFSNIGSCWIMSKGEKIYVR